MYMTYNANSAIITCEQIYTIINIVCTIFPQSLLPNKIIECSFKMFYKCSALEHDSVNVHSVYVNSLLTFTCSRNNDRC